jgi:hypothetical protein
MRRRTVLSFTRSDAASCSTVKAGSGTAAGGWAAAEGGCGQVGVSALAELPPSGVEWFGEEAGASQSGIALSGSGISDSPVETHPSDGWACGLVVEVTGISLVDVTSPIQQALVSRSTSKQIFCRLIRVHGAA